jgi:hypothetical protein
MFLLLLVALFVARPCQAATETCVPSLDACFVLTDAGVSVYSIGDSSSEGSLGAWGSFTDTIASNGWSVLEVHSNGTLADDLQMFAAGFFEGAKTTQRVWEIVYNTQQNTTGFSPQLAQFVADNTAFIKTMVAQNAAVSSYWYHVGLVYTQWDGFVAG